VAALRAAFFEFQIPPVSADEEISLYHHSPRRIDSGFGNTTRFWDGVFDTRFPETVRRALSKN
jgi:hypothetical protein